MGVTRNRRGGAILRVVLIVAGVVAGLVGILALLALPGASRTDVSPVTLLLYAAPALAISALCLRAAYRGYRAESSDATAARSRLGVVVGQLALVVVGLGALAFGAAGLFGGGPTAGPDDLARLGRVIAGALAVFGAACLGGAWILQRQKRGAGDAA